MSQPPRVYWDSSVFLAVLLPEQERRKACLEVLRPAEKREIQIVTSAVTLIEVIKLGKGVPRLPAKDERKIELFFKQPFIVIASATRYIAEESRQLIWQFPKLKPKDSIHLATANFHGIHELHSFDEDHLSLDGQIGEPPMRITHPKTLQPQLPFDEPAEEDMSQGEQEGQEEGTDVN